MVRKERCIVMDLDGTLCPIKDSDARYEDLAPNAEVLAKLREYREMGFYVIIATARNMRTHEGNIGRINAQTLPSIVEWLDRHAVPYDELHVGKPWQGRGGFYVDDKAVRPDEFTRLSYEQVRRLVGEE